MRVRAAFWRRIAVMALLVAAARCASSGAAVPSPRFSRLELPPLALVIDRNESENAWNVVGRLSGGLETVFEDFRLSTSRQGWSWRTVTLQEAGPPKTALIELRQGQSRLLLMIWESGAGRCGFSLGEVPAE